MKKFLLPLMVSSACVLGSGLAYSEENQDVKMINLAYASGCVTCHSIATKGKRPDGSKPFGPAWQSVANRYKGVEGAQEQLVTTVLNGSSPYASHWKDEVSGFAMPPNSVVLNKEQANDLVGWILHLAD